jgi:phosphoglycolate phosphatase
MPTPAALLFDLDGTLVDSAVTIAAALSELAVSRGGLPVDPAQVRPLVSKGAPVLVREALGELARESEADVRAFRSILAGLRAETSMIYPGVLAALEELGASERPCAVVTNKPEGLSIQLLEQLDLARFFVAVVGGDSCAACKPDPAPLRRALALMCAENRPAVMIGDSPVDARAAAAADLPFLLYAGGYEANGCAPADVAACFADFAELPALVETVASAARASRFSPKPLLGKRNRAWLRSGC